MRITILLSALLILCTVADSHTESDYNTLKDSMTKQVKDALPKYKFYSAYVNVNNTNTNSQTNVDKYSYQSVSGNYIDTKHNIALNKYFEQEYYQALEAEARMFILKLQDDYKNSIEYDNPYYDIAFQPLVDIREVKNMQERNAIMLCKECNININDTADVERFYEICRTLNKTRLAVYSNVYTQTVKDDKQIYLLTLQNTYICDLKCKTEEQKKLQELNNKPPLWKVMLQYAYAVLAFVYRYIIGAFLLYQYLQYKK